MVRGFQAVSDFASGQGSKLAYSNRQQAARSNVPVRKIDWSPGGQTPKMLRTIGDSICVFTGPDK
jgi:hypothetical protein